MRRRRDVVHSVSESVSESMRLDRWDCFRGVVLVCVVIFVVLVVLVVLVVSFFLVMVYVDSVFVLVRLG